MADIVIRHGEKTDIEAIRAIYAGKQAYAGTLQLPYPSLAHWESRLESPAHDRYSLVAEVEGEVVGNIGLHVGKNPRRRHAATFGMAVKDSYHGQGIGSALLAAAIDLAENWLNIQRLELIVFVDNEPALSLYKKHGFVIEGESAKYAYRDGEFVSVYHMARVR